MRTYVGFYFMTLVPLFAPLGPREPAAAAFQLSRLTHCRGQQVACAGDLDGDGILEVAVACPGTWASGVLPAGAAYAGKVEILAGSGFKPIRVLRGGEMDIEFGLSMASGRDIDGDGILDLVVGDPGAATSTGNGGGAAYIYSGKTGKLLRTHEGTQLRQKFGIGVALLGDEDGDGVAEVAVGATLGEGVTGPWIGKVVIFSGKGGGEIRSVRGTAKKGDFGASIADVGDLDGDGVSDFAVGEPGSRLVDDVKGRVFVFSGKTGAEIRRIEGESPGDRFGSALSGAGDADGDKVPDLAVGAPGITARNTGFVALFSGKSGRLLARTGNLEGCAGVGRSVAAWGDGNGDGVPDLLAGAPGRVRQPGGVIVLLSGKDLAPIWKSAAVPESASLGSSVAPWGDHDKDGVQDLLAGAPSSGSVHLLSGKDGKVLAEVGVRAQGIPKGK